MRKTSFLFLLIFALTKLQAQDYLISFEGTGGSTTVDSVIVQNLTQGTVLILDGSDTLHLVSSLGIKIPNTSPAKLKIHPNPISFESVIEVFIPSSGNVGLEILDGKGRKILSFYRPLYRGIHSFSLRGLTSGIYYIKLTTSGFVCTDKILSLAAYPETPSMEYIKGVGRADLKYDLKDQTGLVTMQYNEGERLFFKGYSGDFSRILTMVPANSQVVDFEFVPCSDADGNHYAVVTIGTQVWMAENLKTTLFNDGTQIPNVMDNSAWCNLSTPGYCWYDNNISNKVSYGALYNWYAVNTGRLAPAGWHVSSDAEWTILLDYFGGEIVAGGKLKETGFAHWSSPNSGATNETGFSALPGGLRASGPGFSYLGYYGYWWSSTDIDAGFAWRRHMGYDYSYSFRDDFNKKSGFSVRCLKD